MHLTTSLLVSAAASLAAAAPQPHRPIAPPQQHSRSFQLVANVTGADLSPSINDYVLSSYHVGAGQGVAVLVPNDSANAGRVFYVNGTAAEVRYNNANVLSSGGTPPFPFGIQIPPPPETTVFINAGTGTSGVGLARFPSEVTYLVAGTTTFIACLDATLPYGPAIALNVRRDSEPLQEGCVEVKLLPQCAKGDGEAHEFDNVVGCYADVAGIEWGLYGYGA